MRAKSFAFLASGGEAKLFRPTVLTNNIGMPLDIICPAFNIHDIHVKTWKKKGIEMESLIGDKGFHYRFHF